MDQNILFQIQYGLFVLSARCQDRDNGCIINTVMQVTNEPNQIVTAVNRSHLTHDMIMETGDFNISVLTEQAPFELYQHFGYQSGRKVNKLDGSIAALRAENGVCYLTEHVSAWLSARVKQQWDLGTHTLFLAEVTDGAMLCKETPVTYGYYQKNVKEIPKTEAVKGYRCKICGYIYEGDVLPKDYICPVCKYGAEVFEKIG